jgi:hypothetical protein
MIENSVKELPRRREQFYAMGAEAAAVQCAAFAIKLKSSECN